MIWVPFWWRWRQPKLRFGCCWQPSHLYVHFASQNMDYAVSITEKNRPKSKNDSDLLWWRWRQPKLRFGCCCATFAFICPFCFAKYGLCGFDYRKKQTQIEKRFRSVMVEMAVIETASENQFPRISTSVVYLLRFPSRSADKQAFLYGIL